MSDSELSARRPSGAVAVSLKAPLIALAILVIVTVMVIMALDFGHEARRLPLFVGIPLALLAGINLAIEVWEARHRDSAVEPAPEATMPTSDTEALLRQAEDMEPELEHKPGLSLGLALGLVVLLTALYLAFGQLISTPIFIVIAMRFASKRSWRSTALTAIAMTVVLYCLTAVLDLPSYDGWLSGQFPWLVTVIH
jgi:Tripartite tricarboxylate transporter TctB family